MELRSINILPCILALAILASQTSCQKTLNAPRNGMLILNKQRTVAVAFCPKGLFLVKNNKPRIFPLRFVLIEDGWITEPADPSTGNLVPIPDCIPLTSSTSPTHTFRMVADFFQYRGDCQSKEVQKAMERRAFLLGICSSCRDPFIARCG